MWPLPFTHHPHIVALWMFAITLLLQLESEQHTMEGVSSPRNMEYPKANMN